MMMEEEKEIYNGTFKSSKFPHFLVHGNIKALFENKNIILTMEMKGFYHKNLVLNVSFSPILKKNDPPSEYSFKHTTIIISENVEITIFAKKINNTWSGTYEFITSIVKDNGIFLIKNI